MTEIGLVKEKLDLRINNILFRKEFLFVKDPKRVDVFRKIYF